MQDIVESLLLLARLDERGRSERTEPVDLDDLLIEEARRVRSAGSVDVDASGIAGARVAGDPTLLGRALRNLVDNAVRHARSRVALSVRTVGGRCIVRLSHQKPPSISPPSTATSARVSAVDSSTAFEVFIALSPTMDRAPL
jgi:signal transduction histidine kinase